ncbi:MAG: hypothetical protein QOE73_1365 [Verrucomicrobiota bacterium]|jgi:hypothetical protein
MKYKLAVLLGALLCAGALAPTPAQAIGFSIELGDRGYYRHGPWYYNNGARWYWVPGHWTWGRHHRRYWVHGYYAPR